MSKFTILEQSRLYSVQVRKLFPQIHNYETMAYNNISVTTQTILPSLLCPLCSDDNLLWIFSLSFTSLMLPECLFSYQCQAEEKGQLDGLGGHKSCEQIPKSLTRFCFIVCS